jgi:hypothetical protein
MVTAITKNIRITMAAEGDKQGWYIRSLTIRDDYDLFETMEDWPRDHTGIYTLSRAQHVVSGAVNDMKKAVFPLRKADRFNMSWALCNPEGEFIGLFRQKIKEEKDCHMSQIAFKPAFRGLGLTRLVVYFQSYIAWYLYNADKWSFEVMDRNPALMTKVDQFLDNEKDKKGERTGSTGANVERFEMTRAQHEETYNKPSYDKDTADGMDIKKGAKGYKHIFELSGV